MALDPIRRTWRGASARARALVGTAVLIAGCQGAPGAPQGSVAGGPSTAPASGSANLGDMAWIFDTTAKAVDLTVSLDAGRKAEALVPVTGGSISATGADGTVYTLVIPDQALLTDTTIGLTPVASLSGLPFGGAQTYAVQLSPDGLFLYNPAVLTITPAQPIPAGEQIPFGYLGDGKDVILAAPAPGSADIAIRVDHFSGNGVTKGLLADTEPDRRRIGGDAERRLSGVVSDELIRVKQNGGSINIDSIEAAMLAYEKQVVEARVAVAGQSCAKAQLAIESVMSLDRQRSLVGIETSGSSLAKYPGLVEAGARKCVLEEFERCVNDHVVHRMAMVFGIFQRQFAFMASLNLDQAVLREALDLAIKCQTFKLKLESTGSVNVAGAGYTSTVSAEITLRFNPDTSRLGGEGPLVNDAFEFHALCGATSFTGGGRFEVGDLRFQRLNHDPFSSSDDLYFAEEDVDINLRMSYLPGSTSESAKITACPPARGEALYGPTAAWTATFLATHISELDATGEFGGGWIAFDWEMLGGEYYARKEWIKQGPGGTVEAGTFKLYHTPGA
jgi:hypothetical protein